jgi:oligopeptide/dipeptide ABC transporter ATP-binding protein
MNQLLEVEALTVEYASPGEPPNRIVNALSFQLPRGKVVGLAGESGSGKSTAILAVLGLTRRHGRIVGGSVRLEGRELMSLSREEWGKVRGRQIGLVTQNPRASLNPVVRVGQQIAEVYRTHTGAAPEQAKSRALELLRLVGINDPSRRYEAYPDQLSGGMAQRVVISIALACAPKVLIADEPTSGLDVTVRAQILDDLVASVRAVGSGLVLVSQDLAVLANYCDELYLVHAGEIVEQASTDLFFQRPHHPASLALLAAERRFHVKEFGLHGLPIDGRQLPTGCYLAPRCPFVDAAAGCQRVHPDLNPVGDGHYARCLRAATVADAWTEMHARAI